MKWLVIALLALKAHFAVSYLVPLDVLAQRTFGGLLRWAWPWSVGDGGPLGRMTSEGFPVSGFFLAVTTQPPPPLMAPFSVSAPQPGSFP